MSYVTPGQLGEIIDLSIERNDNIYAKAGTVAATIGLTSDGTGYEITLPWFKVEKGLITSYGTNTFTVPQLFTKAIDGSITIE